MIDRNADARRRLSIKLAVMAMAGGAMPGLAFAADDEAIPDWRPRFGRKRPVIAVVALNSGTELTDFAIPYGVLSASGVAETVAVSPRAGEVSMFPALLMRVDATFAAFDAKHPDGADYVVIPALRDKSDVVVLAWLRSQAQRGATLVSICNGAIVLAGTGLLDGKRATAHWASEQARRSDFPKVAWHNNRRYVADGRVVSSAGISASMPVTIALVEAIAGRAQAQALADRYGVRDWSSAHDSDAFKSRPGEADVIFRSDAVLAPVNIALADGIDEVALALTADAYSHTTSTVVYSSAATGAAVRTRHGLLVLPDRIGMRPSTERTLHLDANAAPAQALTTALADIEARYGGAASRNVMRVMEFSRL